jgi:integrase
MTGMRQGELLGLQWPDVDLQAARVHVQHARERVRGSWCLVEPKTDRSRRSIDLPPFVVTVLRAHRMRQLERRLAVGDAWPETEFVFAGPFGEPLDGRHDTSRSFAPLLARAGLPRIRFHDLTHTFATLHLARGIHPKLVQEMLGHSTIALTLDVYSRVTPTMHGEAAERLEAIFATGN